MNLLKEKKSFDKKSQKHSDYLKTGSENLLKWKQHDLSEKKYLTSIKRINK